MSTTSVMPDLVDPVGPGGRLGGVWMHRAPATVFGRKHATNTDLPTVAATAKLPLCERQRRDEKFRSVIAGTGSLVAKCGRFVRRPRRRRVPHGQSHIGIRHGCLMCRVDGLRWRCHRGSAHARLKRSVKNAEVGPSAPLLLRFMKLERCDEQLQFVLGEIAQIPCGKSGRLRWKAEYSWMSSWSVSSILPCSSDTSLAELDHA
jgi:hypothetical protein